MTTPGVGAITALCFGATIDDPTRFGIREQSGSATVDLRRSIPRQLYPPKAAAIAATAKMRVACLPGGDLSSCSNTAYYSITSSAVGAAPVT